MPQYDLAEIADLMHDSTRDGFIDPATGKADWRPSWRLDFDPGAFDDDEFGEIPESWVPIDEAETRDSYGDMEAFALLLPGGELRTRLVDALDGKGAFRRFRNVVYGDPGETGRVWSRFEQARQELRAANWLESLELAGAADASREAGSRLDAIAAEVAARSADDLTVVQELERELQTRECRSDRKRLEQLLAPDFTEVGRSGRVWTREQTLAQLREHSDNSPSAVTDVHAAAIADTVVLVRWAGSEGTQRSSLWRRNDDGDWQIVFHQATRCEDLCED